MTPHARFLVGAFALALTLPWFAGCGGGGGSSSSGATVDVLVTDAPVDDLLSFSARVESIKLRVDGGSLTSNLLDGSLDVEFLGLAALQRWLGTARIPAGTYSGIELEFVPASYVARDLNGALVPVTATGNELLLTFTAPFTVDATGYRRILVDLDLATSLTGTVPAWITFDPQGSASDDDGSVEFPIDEIRGRVVAFDAANFEMTVDAFADSDQTVALGRITVTVPQTATLIDDDDASFPDREAFFDALVAGTTFVEVDGNLIDGTVNATVVQVDDNGAGGGDALVRIEGRILALTGGTTIDLALREIEKGEAVAQPVLAGLGNPASIDVSFNGGTPVFLPEHVPSSTAALAVGQIVKVRFNTFSTEPFPASQIEIEVGRDSLTVVDETNAGELVVHLADLPGVSVTLASAQDLSNVRSGDALRVRGRLLVRGERATFAAAHVERASERLSGELAARADGALVLDVVARDGARYERLELDARTRFLGESRAALLEPGVGAPARVDALVVRSLDGRTLRARTLAIAPR